MTKPPPASRPSTAARTPVAVRAAALLAGLLMAVAMLSGCAGDSPAPSSVKASAATRTAPALAPSLRGVSVDLADVAGAGAVSGVAGGSKKWPESAMWSGPDASAPPRAPSPSVEAFLECVIHSLWIGDGGRYPVARVATLNAESCRYHHPTPDADLVPLAVPLVIANRDAPPTALPTPDWVDCVEVMLKRHIQYGRLLDTAIVPVGEACQGVHQGPVGDDLRWLKRIVDRVNGGAGR